MEENIVVPEKFILNNTKVHRIEGYDEIRSNAKLAKKKQEFINETNKVLSLFDIDAKKYDYKLHKVYKKNQKKIVIKLSALLIHSC